MYPSLFFGEPSRAELFTQRAEPSRALWFQKPSQNEPDFFLRAFLKQNKSDGIEFQDFHWDNNGPKKFLLKSILQVPRKSFLPGLYWYSTQYDEVPVFIFKTNIDWPWLFAGFPATDYNLYWDIWVYVLKSKSTLQFKAILI